MTLNQPDRQLIDRYLNGELSGIELDNFQNRLQHDEVFKSRVGFQNLLRSGIILSKEEELRKKILEKIKFKKTRVPLALKLIVTFLIVTGAGITLWFYVGTESATQDKRFFINPFSPKEKEKKESKKMTESKNKTVQEEETPSGENQKEIAGTEEKNALQAGTTENQAAVQTAGDSMLLVSEEDKGIVIKKDKMLISATLHVNEKSFPDNKAADAKNENATLSQEASQKLNPEAGVPEDEKISSDVLVEFWVSPINYKGYKMSKNKLILFGIEEPDAVKLFRLNDLLYMKYGNEFYRLMNTYDFLAFQRLKDADVPLAIRQ